MEHSVVGRGCWLAVATLALPACFLGLDERALTSDGAASRQDASLVADAAVPPDADDAAVPPDANALVDEATPADLASASSDATTVDLSTADRVPLIDFAIPACGGQLCEDFENGLAGAWGERQDFATLTVDGNRAWRGTHSLRVDTQAVAAGTVVAGELGENATFGTSPTDLYLRAWLYLPSPAPAQHFRAMAAFENVSPYDGVALFVDAGNLAIADATTGSYHLSTTPLPLDRWTCVEWHVHQSTTSGGFDLWLDGAQLGYFSQFTEATQPPAAPLGALSLGLSVFESTTPIPALTMWLDAIEVSTSRIGCQ